MVFVPQQVELRTGTPVEPAPASPSPPTESTEPAYEPKPMPVAGMMIDVNTASADQLQLLPGIGPSRAAAIIESRNTQGPFRTVEDLARVRGIGPATVEGVRPYVRIEPVSEPK